MLSSFEARGNRGRGFDRHVLYAAPYILALQEKGLRSTRDLARALNELGLEAPSGSSWSYGVMHRVLERGAALDLFLPLRSASAAARQRPYVHRQSRSRHGLPRTV